MSRKKITLQEQKIILSEKKKFPYLGVRALTNLVRTKHKIHLSKSAIHKILKTNKLDSKPGRKEALLLYKSKNEIKNCGLLLLEAIDDQIGLFEQLNFQLRSHFPRLDKYSFQRFLALSVFSSLLNKTLKESIQEEGFLRLVGLKRLSVSKIDYFNGVLESNKLIASLKPVKDNVRLVSTLKFHFKNGHEGYADAKLSTFWDRPCNLEHFYTPLKAARKRLEQMLENKILIIGYTKSFDYLSPLVFDFLQGLESGLKKVQFLNGAGQTLDEIVPSRDKFKFAIGYYPKILLKGTSILSVYRRPRRLCWEEIDEFSCQITITKFLQLKQRKELIFNNVLISRDKSSAPIWGVFTNLNLAAKYSNLSLFLQKYLYLWPYLEKGFQEDMKILEKAYSLSPKKREYLVKILPEKLAFRHSKDFVWVGQILSTMFKELIYGWEPKNKTGNLTWGKEYLKIFFPKMPKEAKKNFNKASLYVAGKRAFIL